MLEFIWNDILYRPLFNGLIWIYNNWTDQNLGWAVVYLTLILRTAMLPITIIGERNRAKNLELIEELKKVDKDYHKDPILKKQEIRKRIKARRIKPWTSVASLSIQLLVLVLLYQVFWHGITGEKIIKILYDTVNFPGSINVYFYGFDLGATHDIIWSGMVGLFLLTEIYVDYKKRKPQLSQADLFYFILFPAFSAFVLWMLPMVKSLFILTSMVFTLVVKQFTNIMFKPKK